MIKLVNNGMSFLSLSLSLSLFLNNMHYYKQLTRKREREREKEGGEGEREGGEGGREGREGGEGKRRSKTWSDTILAMPTSTNSLNAPDPTITPYGHCSTPTAAIHIATQTKKYF